MTSQYGSDVPIQDASGPERRRVKQLGTPGHLHGEVVLHIHTVQGQRLITGRAGTPEKRGFMGLFGFAERVSQIWRGAQAGDPFADWWLLKLEQSLSRAEARLRDLRAAVGQHLADVEGMSIEVPTSTAPLPIALEFTTPIAYRAAQLVGVYDQAIRETLAARHVARMTSDAASHTVWLAGHEMRSAFDAALGYVTYGVTREDVSAGAAQAVVAASRLGALPTDVLADLRRAQFAPTRIQGRKATDQARGVALTDSDAASVSPDAGVNIGQTFDDDLGRLFAED